MKIPIVTAVVIQFITGKHSDTGQCPVTQFHMLLDLLDLQYILKNKKKCTAQYQNCCANIMFLIQ